MKYGVLVLALFITSLSYAAPCIPNPSTFNRFLTKILNEREYHGKGEMTFTPVGGETTRTPFTGYFSFRKRAAHTISFGSIRCSESGCDQTDQYWVFARGCMYIEGNRVTFTRVTANELRFRFNYGDSRFNYSLRLPLGARLDINITRDSAVSNSTVTFSGTGR